VLGYLLWDEMPNWLAWTGIALLVGSGLTILQTERQRQQAAERHMEGLPPKP
jgi:drug/metabolite transporter (DMT)-like permease